MALYTYHHDAPRLVAAAREWADRCLIADRSLFVDSAVWTAANFEALDVHFLQNMDAGTGSFNEKLAAQLADAPADAKKLMAELLWALFLFPSNISEEVKRAGVMQIWAWSGEQLDETHPLLSDAIFDGVGSGGMGVNTNRWRELRYLVRIGQSMKSMGPEDRRAVLIDYDRHLQWIDTLPNEGDRQFRHMLRYFLFPERVERMSTNRDRIAVLAAYGVAKPRDLRSWDDRQLDAALLKLRRELEESYQSTEIDFYLDPLLARWRPEADPGHTEESPGVDSPRVFAVAEPTGAYIKRAPRNVVLYGPPGTGKTMRLQSMFRDYLDPPADVDREEWAMQLVASRGWRAVIAVALAECGPADSRTVMAHPLVVAKAKQRDRHSGVQATVAGYLQAFTVADLSSRERPRTPAVFTKVGESPLTWAVVHDWQSVDPEAAELAVDWKRGPESRSEELRRFRVVTFHPSYSYEDFVIGLRPVVGEDGATGFQMVDGVFKQICTQARSNPGKKHALFIDEINRANIAKVFGELITLIEVDKRARYDAHGRCIGGLEVQLPGTGGEEGGEIRFGVPDNLDIIGTMNTADRSIALLDIALRRRFEFEELGPDPSVINRVVDGVELHRLLARINERLEFLAGRDRLIGHGYFTAVGSLDDLRKVFSRQIIPLLQEYFHDDFAQVHLTLSGSDGSTRFLQREALRADGLFGGSIRDLPGHEFRYRLTPSHSWDAQAFQAIYGHPAGSRQAEDADA